MLRIEADYDNIRTALATILKQGDIDVYLQTCMNLARAWQHDGLHLEAMDFFLAGLKSDFAANPRARIDAWCYAAELALDITLPISVNYAEQAVQLADQLRDPIALGKSQLVLGMSMCNTTTRDEEGGRLVVAGMEAVRSHPDTAWYPNAAWQHAYLNMCSGFFFPESHPEKAQRFKDGLDGFLGIGDPEMIGRARTLSIALWGLDEDWAFEQLGQAVESLRLNRKPGGCLPTR